jgi:pteridine reductase
MKTAVITGAGIRIGKSIANILAENGFHVVCHANRSIEKAKELVQSLQLLGYSAEAIQADLSSSDAVEQFGKTLCQKFDRIDVLVNNAAIYQQCSFEEVSRTAFRNMMSINLEAPFFLTQMLLPALKKAHGCVINVTDSALNLPYGEYSHYFASKAAFEMLTKVLAIELAPVIRVNGVAPGTVAYPENFSSSIRESIRSKIPLKRIGSEEDIAKAVWYLIEQATFTTGQILRIDGGSSVGKAM